MAVRAYKTDKQHIQVMGVALQALRAVGDAGQDASAQPAARQDTKATQDGSEKAKPAGASGAIPSAGDVAQTSERT